MCEWGLESWRVNIQERKRSTGFQGDIRRRLRRHYECARNMHASSVQARDHSNFPTRPKHVPTFHERALRL